MSSSAASVFGKNAVIWGAWIEEQRSDLRNEFKSNIVGRLSDEIRVSGGLKFRPWFAEKASLDTSMYFYKHMYISTFRTRRS